MTLDTTINLPTLVTIGLAVLAGLIWLIRLEGRVSSNRTDIDDISKTLGGVQALISLHKEQFHAYQLEAAQKFTTREIIAEIKADFSSQLGRVEQRIEVQINRLAEGRRE